MILSIPKVYVIHYTKLIDRKNKIEDQFANIANIEFINEYDKEELSNDVLNKFYLPSTNEWNKKVSPLWNVNIHRFRILNPAEISCTIKHIMAIKKVAENGDAFIIEDDLLINSNFVNDFNEMINDLPNDWDIIMVGAGCNMHANIIGNQKFYKASNPATRCLDSYLLSQKAAIKIMETIIPFQLVSDWELAYHLYKHELNTYWLEPSLCSQGSETGVYKSTLR